MERQAFKIFEKERRRKKSSRENAGVNGFFFFFFYAMVKNIYQSTSKFEICDS